MPPDAPQPLDDVPRGAGARPAADLSLAGRMLAALRKGADLRRRKVRRLRAAVRAQKYENDLKLHVALERLKQNVSEGNPTKL